MKKAMNAYAPTGGGVSRYWKEECVFQNDALMELVQGTCEIEKKYLEMYEKKECSVVRKKHGNEWHVSRFCKRHRG